MPDAFDALDALVPELERCVGELDRGSGVRRVIVGVRVARDGRTRCALATSSSGHPAPARPWRSVENGGTRRAASVPSWIQVPPMRIEAMFATALLLGACSADRGGQRPSARPVPPAPVVVSQHEPPHLLLVESGLGGAPRETLVRWRGPSLETVPAGRSLPLPVDRSEDAGLFAFAVRPTALRVEPNDTSITIGRLARGARVGVREVRGAWARVILFAWRAAVERSAAPLEAWTAVADIGVEPRSPPPSDGSAVHEPSYVYPGNALRGAGGAPIAYTFCGPVEVLGSGEDGLRVAQTEEGVTVEGIVARDLVRRDVECRAPVVVETSSRRIADGATREDKQLFYRRHDHLRRHWGPLPAGLVPVGASSGPSLRALARRGAPVYWLTPDEDKVAVCSRWKLSAQGASGEGTLVARSKLDGGDTLVTTFDVRWSDAEQAHVTLLGPSSEVISPPGRAPASGGIGVACGSTLRVVASDAEMLILLRGEGGIGGDERVVAYDPRATERWYVDAARCEADARRARAAAAAKVALGFSLSGGC